MVNWPNAVAGSGFSTGTTRRLVALWLCTLAAMSSGWACSVPVFRYALERWPASPYQLSILHRGPLEPAQKNSIDALERELLETNKANLVVERIDLDNDPPAAVLQISRKLQLTQFPAFVLRYPENAPAEGELAWGIYNPQAIRELADSPARRRVAQRLLGGDTAVWVLIESGRGGEDAAAASVLEKELKRMESVLKISKPDPADLEVGVSAPELNLKVAFRLVRLARETPAEKFFIRMLLGTEEDLSELTDPIVLPVFGRARALFAISGKGINAENIEEACSFLVGPCSCVVKEQNPGLDLLVSADWDKVAQTVAEPEPELASPAAFAPPMQAATSTSSTNVIGTGPSQPTPISRTTRPVLSVGLLWVGGAGALGILAGTLVLLFRRKE